MELEKDQKKENEMVKWKEGSLCEYGLRRSACKCAMMEIKIYNLNLYSHKVCDRSVLVLWVLLLRCKRRINN